jgi:hydrogenase maturation protease
MRDDGVGIVIARELEKRNLGKDVLVLQRQMLDISLLLLSEDASRLIVVDAVRSGKRPGTLVRFRATGRGSPSLKVPLSHGMQVSDLVKLAKKNRISLCPISVVGVEPAVCTIGENLTKAVRDAVPAAVEAVLEELGRTVEEPAD